MPEENRVKKIFAGFLQFDVKSGDISGNLSRVETGLSEIGASGNLISPGLIVLPELWATGFAYEMLPELTGEIPDLLKVLQNLAAKYQICIAGSLPENSQNTYYNTLYFTDPSGVVGKYRKQRLFNPMQEDTFFASGTAADPVQAELGRIGALVCYDLRFPELLRQQTARGAEIAVVSAQWPAARREHWRTLLQARAIENQIFVVAANRCGTTGDTPFGGHSMIIAPDGSMVIEAGGSEEFKGAVIDLEMIAAARTLFCTVPGK